MLLLRLVAGLQGGDLGEALLPAVEQQAAPFFKDRELVVLSTCSPIASADIHWRFMRGRAVVVGCPKLDRTDPYVGKLVFFRVYRGTLNKGSTLYNSRTGKAERVSRLMVMHADRRNPSSRWMRSVTRSATAR